MKVFFTSIKPDYAIGDESYSPWILSHEDYRMLDKYVILGYWWDWVEGWGRDEVSHNMDIMDEFYAYLGEQGYGIYTYWNSPVAIPVNAVDDADDYDYERERYFKMLDGLAKTRESMNFPDNPGWRLWVNQKGLT